SFSWRSMLCWMAIATSVAAAHFPQSPSRLLSHVAICQQNSSRSAPSRLTHDSGDVDHGKTCHFCHTLFRFVRGILSCLGVALIVPLPLTARASSLMAAFEFPS